MRNNEERFGANPQRQDSTPLQQILQQNQPSIEIKNSQNLSLDFIVPTEFVELPSKGMFYPQGHPLKGKESIEIKQMTAKEEDILNSRSLLKKGMALDKLIQSLVVDKSINCDTLTIEDRNAILVAARVAAYGADYNTEITCPSCSEKKKHTFNLLEENSVVEVNGENYQESINEDGIFFIELPVSKWIVACRVLNGGDEKTILRIAEAKKKNNSQNDSFLVDQLKLSIVSIQGVTDRELVNRAVDTMPARDSKFLRGIYQKIVPSMKIVRKFNCVSCDYEADMEVPLSTDFFWFK